MDYQLISQKLRELAYLFDESTMTQHKDAESAKPVQAKPIKTVQAKAPEPVQIEQIEQIELELQTPPETTLDDLRQGMAELIGSGKRDTVLAILAKLGVKKVSDIPEDKFGQAMAAINGTR